MTNRCLIPQNEMEKKFKCFLPWKLLRLKKKQTQWEVGRGSARNCFLRVYNPSHSYLRRSWLIRSTRFPRCHCKTRVKATALWLCCNCRCLILFLIYPNLVTWGFSIDRRIINVSLSHSEQNKYMYIRHTFRRGSNRTWSQKLVYLKPKTSQPATWFSNL